MHSYTAKQYMKMTLTVPNKQSVCKPLFLLAAILS